MAILVIAALGKSDHMRGAVSCAIDFVDIYGIIKNVSLMSYNSFILHHPQYSWKVYIQVIA